MIASGGIGMRKRKSTPTTPESALALLTCRANKTAMHINYHSTTAARALD
jgi:hypothetical protein